MSSVEALRRSGEYQKGDERILGDGDFVGERSDKVAIIFLVSRFHDLIL